MVRTLGVAVALLCFLLGGTSIGWYNEHQGRQTDNQAWREAAAPIWQSRGWGFMRDEIPSGTTPQHLANHLNPCYAFTYLERGARHQPGCNPATGKPKERVFVTLDFMPTGL